MRTIKLDSFLHYRLEKRDGGISLVQYGKTSACPGMGDRGAFLPTEGVQVAWTEDGEEVEFVVSLVSLRVTKEMADSQPIHCGDDFQYFLRDQARAQA